MKWTIALMAMAGAAAPALTGGAVSSAPASFAVAGEGAVMVETRSGLGHDVVVQDTAKQRLRFVTAPEGNKARYRVREQLVGLQFPNDAVGETEAIEGVLVLEADGRVVKEESKFTVDLRTLKSDKSRRDGFVQRNTLNTAEFPHAIFVPTAIQGLTLPLPESGELTLRLEGELTIRGVTRPTVWDLTLKINGKEYTGHAATVFDFGAFGLTIPRVRSVLSVVDEIRLEYDLKLVGVPVS